MCVCFEGLVQLKKFREEEEEGRGGRGGGGRGGVKGAGKKRGGFLCYSDERAKD